MSLLLLIPLSLCLGLIGVGAFIWALRDGQFDDPDGAAWRIIPHEPEGQHDDDLAPDPAHRNAPGGL